MNATQTVTVTLRHNASIPGARWCEPVGWEPANVVADADFIDGAWWYDDEQAAGLVWFGERDAYGANETIECSLGDLRVVSCGDCRVIGPVAL